MANPEGIYFISFAAIDWIDVFIRELYFQIVVDSLNYCTEHKGLLVHCYVIMPSHIHLIFQDRNSKPSKLLKEFKIFTSKSLRKCISANLQESRRKWMLKMMRESGRKNSNVKEYQFWQQHNHPRELWSNWFIDQKVCYIHRNPVKAGFVCRPEDWKYSSAADYGGVPGPVKVFPI
jgi:REP element-mobilizing transposase RayT